MEIVVNVFGDCVHINVDFLWQIRLYFFFDHCRTFGFFLRFEACCRCGTLSLLFSFKISKSWLDLGLISQRFGFCRNQCECCIVDVQIFINKLISSVFLHTLKHLSIECDLRYVGIKEFLELLGLSELAQTLLGESRLGCGGPSIFIRLNSFDIDVNLGRCIVRSNFDRLNNWLNKVFSVSLCWLINFSFNSSSYWDLSFALSGIIYIHFGRLCLDF